MKKILSLILIAFLFQSSLNAQDFALTNPVMSPNPGVFPGGSETVSFNFSVSQNYTFSSDANSNNYAYITFSFTKLNPTASGPAGTGAALFNWKLTTNGGNGVGLVYTWTGTTKDVTMQSVPTNYNIVFTNVPITAESTPAQTDVRVAGQFTDPGNAPTGMTGNNNAVIATYTGPAGGPLPIRLLSFNGIKDETKVQLNWQTSTEQNSKYFNVEYSADGNTWNSIGTVNAAGISTSARNYSLVHSNPVDGMNYYRLQQFDISGNFVYSNIIAIKFTIKGLNIGAIYPNPFIDKLKLDVSSEKDETISIQITDNLARVLKVQTVSIKKGANPILLENLGNLASGMYNIVVKTSYSSYRYKLRK